MRLVHLADLHLGFSRYARLAAEGTPGADLVGVHTAGETNQREADVAATFVAVITRVIALRPDVVVVAGDVFHGSRPLTATLLLAQREFGRLRRALPDTPVVIIAGNHDLPLTLRVDPCPLRLLEALGVTVIDWAAERLTLLDGALSILAVPEMRRIALPAFAPDPAARHNVLLFHGEVLGAFPSGSRESALAHAVTPAELAADRWDYIALGHYHVTTAVAPNAWYAGSIDYTSSNVWGELQREQECGRVGKAFLEWDLETGTHTVHPIPVSRRHLDLPAVGAHGLGVDELNAAIAAAIEGADIDDAVVRLKVLDLDPLVARALDQRMIRSAKQRALNFQLEERRAIEKAPSMDVVAGQMRAAAAKIGRGGKGIRQIVTDHLAGCDIPVDLNREELTTMALEYLDRATTAFDRERDSATEEVAA